MRRQATVRSTMDRPAQAYTSKATAARPFGDRSGAATSLTGSTLNNPVRRDPEVRQALSSWWEAAMASARMAVGTSAAAAGLAVQEAMLKTKAAAADAAAGAIADATTRSVRIRYE